MSEVVGVRTHSSGWIGVDLDGTLSQHHDGLNVNEAIGPPVPEMVARIQMWLQLGWEVRVVTARVSSGLPKEYRDKQQKLICAWTEEHVGTMLLATSEKDYNMLELWDDRAWRVERNTGRRI